MADIINVVSDYALGGIDTGTTLVDEVSPYDAKHINGPVTAIIQIETALGTAPSLIGSKADLATRLAVGLDTAGKLNLSTDGSINGPLSAAKGGTGQATPLVPPGSIMIWPGASAPSSWWLCDGSALNRSLQPALFAVITTYYGPGDGSTTFNVPDLRGRVVIMVDGSANRITAASTNGGNADTLGGVGGAETHTLSVAQVPVIQPTIPTTSNDGVSVTVDPTKVRSSVIDDTVVNSAHTSSFGSGLAHSNTQPWMALNYIIKL